MTPSEQKIFEAVMDLAKKQAEFNANFINLSKVVDNHTDSIDALKTDRNKVIGMSIFGSFLVAIGSVVWEIFKHS